MIPITLIMSYDESEVSGIDENTLVPILLVGNDWVTVVVCEADDPLIPDPCLANRDTINNELTIKTTHFSIYGVQGAAILPIPFPIVSTELALALEPLEASLVRVWHFDNATKKWSFFDPRPVFADVNTLTELVNGQIYWIKVMQDQMVPLNDKARILISGWNSIVW